MDLKKIKTQNVHDLGNLFESAVQGYALIDKSFNLIAFNNKMQKFLQSISGVKIEKEQSILKSIPALFKKDFNSSARKAFKGKPSIEEKQFTINEDWFKISYTPYFKNEQEVEAVLISITDSNEWQIQKMAEGNAEFMDSIFDTASGIALVNKNGVITKVNNSFCRILGYTQDELLKINYFDLVFSADKKNSRERHKRLFSDHRSFSGEVRLIHKNGKIIMILKQTTYLKNDVSEPLIIISIADITERKHVEQELKAREMFYKALLERSADMKILTTAEGHIIFGSSSITKFLGYSFEELEGHHVAEFVPMEDIPQIRLRIQEVIQRPGTSVQLQQRIIHKNGEWRYCEGTVTNLLNDPNVGTLVSNFRDITEKRCATELLKKSEATLRAIFNNVDIAFVLLNPKMDVILFNSVAEDWSMATFGRKLEKESNFIGYLSQNTAGIFENNFHKVLENNIFNSEVNYKTETGKILWYEVRISPVLNENEEVIGVCITSSDITVKKYIEIEKEKITHDLIKKNKDLQQFAYIVSHNLRGPTANIMALSDMLKNFKNLGKIEKDKILDGLSTSSHQLDMVIRDLNQILQIENTVGEKKEWIDFTELLQELRLTIDHLVSKEGAKIITDFNDATTVKTIRLYLYSIFYNLITNSLKYSDPLVSPVITIKSKKVDGGVELSFSDNGIGIDLTKYGDKMFRLYNRFHLHKEGKGMGLFMVKTQIEAMGGKIDVYSEPGKGTEFRIKLKNEISPFL
ncbi:MAG: sensor histidine kinase [Bacteroidetes bacterium]|nr:sensor histidine kinase [Bacteroidota bacterium]